MTQTSLIEHYRKRFHLDKSVKLPPDLATLEMLIELHLEHITFDNLSLHMTGETEEAVVLKRGDLINKLFRKRRGGCCLELNGAFSFFLQDLGFPVRLVPCWVYAGKERGHRNKRAKFRTVASHFILLVTIVDDGNNYIVDVGFGEPPNGALPYSSSVLTQQLVTPDGMTSRIIRDPQGPWVDGQGVTRVCVRLEWLVDGTWEPRLQWDVTDAPLDGTTPVPLRTLDSFAYVIDILKGPKTSFARKLIVCSLTRDTKLSLSGRRLRLTTPRFGPDKRQTVTDLETDQDVAVALKTHFEIELQLHEKLNLTKSDIATDPRLWGHL